MKRRHFLAFSAAVLGAGKSLVAKAADAPKVTAKDILKEGQPASVANYCEHPEKQPNKACPTKPGGICKDCNFFNRDNSLTKFEGKDVAKCQLLSTAPSYVYATASCATFVKKM